MKSISKKIFLFAFILSNQVYAQTSHPVKKVVNTTTRSITEKEIQDNVERLEKRFPSYSISYFEQTSYKIIDAGKIGFLNVNGEVTVKPTYDFVGRKYESGLWPVMKDRKWGYINSQGQVIVPLQYDYASPFEGGFGRVKLNNKWGGISANGNLIVKPIYDEAYTHDNYNYKDEVIHVKLNGKFGLIDKTGKVLAEPIYTMARAFSEDLAQLCLDNTCGFIDKTGKFVIPISNNYDSFHGGLAAIQVNGKNGFVDKTAKIIIPPVYDSYEGFTEDIAPVKMNDKWGFIDKKGKAVVPFIYDEAEYFKNGLCRVKSGNKYGFIDRKGTLVIPAIYEQTPSASIDGFFENGYSTIMLKFIQNGWGVIDKRNNVIFPFKYARVYYINKINGFHLTTATTPDGGYHWNNKDEIYRNVNGKFILENYDNIGSIDPITGSSLVCKNEKWGLMNKIGDIVVQFKFDSPNSTSSEDGDYTFINGLLKLRLNNKWGYLNNLGKEIIPFMYDYISAFKSGVALVELK